MFFFVTIAIAYDPENPVRYLRLGVWAMTYASSL
jgi:hypothetical protein